MPDNTPNIIYVGFADNKVPEFKEVRNKDYILFGEDNKFPDRLLYLFNKSSNHGAIVNGKVKYIFGKGFEIAGTKLTSINRRNESLNKVSRKLITDIELFGGYHLEIIWNKGGGFSDVLHMPFQCLRRAKEDKGWLYKKDWKDNRETARAIPDFDPANPTGAQIFSYKEYRPGADVYALPGYMASLNDIETDVEISKYNLSTIKNGMFGGKMVTFFNGEPTPEAKKQIEKGWKDKFNGSENAGTTMFVFNSAGQTAPTVEDLSSTDLDKLFDQLNKTTQAEIFTGHEVVSSTLFGVKTEGGLGDRAEIETAYEIFKNTYVNNKQEAFEESIAFLYSYFGVSAPLKLIPTSPLAMKIDNTELYKYMSQDEIREVAGLKPLPKAQSEGADTVTNALNSLSPLVANKVLESMSENEIRRLIGLTPKAGGDIAIQSTDPVTGQPTDQQMVNDNVKNLSGKQHQQLLRIIRQYSQGKINKQVATTLLKTGLGLSDTDIEAMLGDEQAFSAQQIEEELVAEMFSAIGESRQNFSIIKSKPYQFDKEDFADIKLTDSNILDLIKKDNKITPEVIATTIKESVEYVRSRIESLEKTGVLKSSTQTIGRDTIIERAVNTENIDTRAKPETIDVYIKYSYEAKAGLDPVIETTRPFCRRLISLNRLYTRAEIESISQRVGYSVFDRKGGFWGDRDECRHRWVRNVVIKKSKK